MWYLVYATVTCTTHTEVAETKCVMFLDQLAVGGSLPVMGPDGWIVNWAVVKLPTCGVCYWTTSFKDIGLLLCWRDIRGDDKVHTRYAGHVQLAVGEVYNTSLCCNHPCIYPCHRNPNYH